MSTFRCAANGAARSWISPIQVREGLDARSVLDLPGMRPPLLDDLSPPKTAYAILRPMERGNATLATTPEASCPRVPQVVVWSAAIPDERAVGQP